MTIVRVRKEQEIREVFKYLSRDRGHHSQFIMRFLARNYFISTTTVYRILQKPFEDPIKADEASITFKAVFDNEYYDL